MDTYTVLDKLRIHKPLRLCSRRLAGQNTGVGFRFIKLCTVAYSTDDHCLTF